MNVTHYMRNPHLGEHSIEQIFEGVRHELSGKVDFKVYYPQKAFDLQSIFEVRKHFSEVNHITGGANYLSFGLSSRKTILTVHDIGHFECTLKGFKKFLYGLIWFHLPLSRVEKVTAISNFTANKLMHHFAVPSKKIEIISNPLLPVFKPYPKEINLDFPTILQIGSSKNKNLDRLIDAVTMLPCKLLLVRGPDPYLKQKLIDRNIQFDWRSNVSMEEVVAAYREADIVFFASTYEGFGMPIIEAQGIGRPVITSNIAPMSEIAGENGALSVDPYSMVDIRKSIIKLKESKSLSEELIINGLRNVQKYSLKSIADSYYKLYQTLE